MVKLGHVCSLSNYLPFLVISTLPVAMALLITEEERMSLEVGLLLRIIVTLSQSSAIFILAEY